jgi:hypothetical protein
MRDGKERRASFTLMSSKQYRLERRVGTRPLEEKTVCVDLSQRQPRMPAAALSIRANEWIILTPKEMPPRGRRETARTRPIAGPGRWAPSRRRPLSCKRSR